MIRRSFNGAALFKPGAGYIKISRLHDTIIPMAKKQKMPISAIEAKEAMDLAQRDCDVLWKIEKLLEKIGIAKHKYMLHSRDMWTFSFLRELYHLKHIRPDLSKLIQKTIDDTSKKAP